jgi:hypothetical protein
MLPEYFSLVGSVRLSEIIYVSQSRICRKHTTAVICQPSGLVVMGKINEELIWILDPRARVAHTLFTAGSHEIGQLQQIQQ